MIAIPFLKGETVDLMVKIIPEGLKPKLGKTQKKIIKSSEENHYHWGPQSRRNRLGWTAGIYRNLGTWNQTWTGCENDNSIYTAVLMLWRSASWIHQMTCFIVFFRCCFILFVATEGRFKGDVFVGGFLELIVFFLFFFRGWGGMMCWVTLQDVL